MGILPRLLACSGPPTPQGLCWNARLAGEARNPADPCPPLVHPLLGLCWNTPAGERESCPVPLPAPGPSAARGLCWNTPVGRQESCPGPLPAHYSGPLLEYACTHMSLTSKCQAAIELGVGLGHEGVGAADGARDHQVQGCTRRQRMAWARQSGTRRETEADRETTREVETGGE